jgi:hypothetical protein
MTPFRTALIAALALGTVTAPAVAQSRQAAPPPPPRPPVVIINPVNPYDRGPPAQPERRYVGPREGVAPPMDRTPQPAPLSPRMGN